MNKLMAIPGFSGLRLDVDQIESISLKSNASHSNYMEIVTKSGKSHISYSATMSVDRFYHELLDACEGGK